MRYLSTQRVGGGYLARDQFHLNDLGYRCMAEHVARAVTVALLQPDQALNALERIETAGLRALAAMDRAVHMLHGPAPLPGLADLPGLLARFAEAGPFRVQLDLDRALLALRSGRVRTDGIVTDVVGLEDHASALQAVRSSRSVKAVVAAGP